MKVNLSVKNLGRAQKALKGLTPLETPEIATRMLRESIGLIERVAKASYMSGPASKGMLGEDHGDLKASLQIDESRLPYAIKLGSTLAYGPVHEYARGGARSYLRRAYKSSIREIRGKIKESWQKALEGLST